MRRLLIFLPVVGLLAAALPTDSAVAQEPTSSIEATVAGTTEGGSTCAPDPSSSTGWRKLDTGDECDPETDTASGKFNGVVLSGLFTAFDGEEASSCQADVTLDTDDGSIGFTEEDNVLASEGDLDDVGFSGGNNPANNDAVTCAVEGSISNGTFVRVGTTAVADLDVHFEVWKWVVVDEVLTKHLHVRGWVHVTATVSAVPGAGDPPGDPASAQVEGTVAGQCPPSQTSPTTPCAA